MQRFPLIIKDAQSTDNYVTVKTPYDGAPVAEVEKADGPALELALSNAENVFKSTMRHMPAYQRAEILYKVAALVSDRVEELALTIAREGGKPLKDARVEVLRAVNTIKMSGDEALALNGETLTMDRAAGTDKHLAFTIREPIGPVLAISAFNHPLNLICHQVATAFAAGNTVLVKPASQTPVSCLRLVQLFYEAGLPDGVISVTFCSGGEADTLVRDSRIRFVTFIGGEDVGWQIFKKVSPGVGIALEHGGTGTAIVTENADIERTVPNLARAAFYHAGQVCVSTQIINAHDSVFDQLITELRTVVDLLKTGDPTDEQTDVGPLITQRDVERVDRWNKEALDCGAKLVSGGAPLDNNCYQPTILTDTTPEMNVISKEIFGPVVCVQRYSDLSETIAQMNQSPYSFQSAIYTQDIDQALYAAREVETKAFMINESTAFRVDWMPFGGSKHSGFGTGGTRHSVYDMTEEKLIVMRPAS